MQPSNNKRVETSPADKNVAPSGATILVVTARLSHGAEKVLSWEGSTSSTAFRRPNGRSPLPPKPPTDKAARPFSEVPAEENCMEGARREQLVPFLFRIFFQAAAAATAAALTAVSPVVVASRGAGGRQRGYGLRRPTAVIFLLEPSDQPYFLQQPPSLGFEGHREAAWCFSSCLACCFSCELGEFVTSTSCDMAQFSQ